MTDQRIVLISGASSGIGRATAELLASRGHRVFGTAARDPDTVAPVRGVELLPLDVRDDASVASSVEAVFTKTPFGANAIHALQTIAASAGTLRQVSDTIIARTQDGSGPETVAAEILRAIERPHRMRRPVGFEALLLSRLRRFMPARSIEASARHSP